MNLLSIMDVQLNWCQISSFLAVEHMEAEGYHTSSLWFIVVLEARSCIKQIARTKVERQPKSADSLTTTDMRLQRRSSKDPTGPWTSDEPDDKAHREETSWA